MWSRNTLLFETLESLKAFNNNNSRRNPGLRNQSIFLQPRSGLNNVMRKDYWGSQL
jgi:hypothetical protein